MKSSSAAFTLIELLIVVAISAVFSGMAITYSGIGRNEVALSVEAAKISQFILQAKELSITTYGSASACGYGVKINTAATPQTYSIFTYSPGGNCPNVGTITGINGSQEQQYTGGTWQVPVTKGVSIQTQNNSLDTVLFYPPDPAVFLSTDGATFTNQTLDVYLVATGGNGQTVTVNPEGQVSVL